MPLPPPKNRKPYGDMPIFRRIRHAGNSPAGLPADSHGQFSINTNRRQQGIFQLQSETRIQESEL